MAPPRLNTPWVKRSIGFLPADVEMLEAVRTRLNEPDGSAAIRRLIRDAFNGAQATHLPAKPAKPASEPEKPPSVTLKSRPAFNPQPKKGKK
jgi:hypothetical protein